MAKQQRYRWQQSGYASPNAKGRRPVKSRTEPKRLSTDAATEKQVGFLKSLCHERGLPIPDTENLTVADASMRIDALLGKDKSDKELSVPATHHQMMIIQLLDEQVGAPTLCPYSYADAERVIEGLLSRRNKALGGDRSLLGSEATLS